MLIENIIVKDFLELAQDHLVIDVRAPIEFNNGHVPGAINIPLFEDIERAEIGTLYKQKGKDPAVMRGFEIASPKFIEFIKLVKNTTKKNDVFVYCFRGGMRSNTFGWLLNTAGLNARVMKGGYKAYRNHLLSEFESPKKLILLGGSTGSGKTEILYELQKQIQLIDLEKLANHKGSAFGSINQPPQLTQQLFENSFYDELIKQNFEKYILLEDESMSIGFNKIPYTFWLQMKSSPIIKINVPFELRVNRLVKDYGNTSAEKLKKGLISISSRLGPNYTAEAMKHLEDGNLADFMRIALKYYDKAYNFNYTKGEKKTIFEVETDTDDIKINASKVKTIFDEYRNR